MNKINLAAILYTDWKPHPTKKNAIIGKWAEDDNEYEILCPSQLREQIIAMQNIIPLLQAQREKMIKEMKGIKRKVHALENRLLNNNYE